MGRYGRMVIFIAVIVIVAALILGFQSISIGDFERGGDTPLGLSLGLDLQGGSHLVYQADPVEVTEDQMYALKRTIERRVNNSGLGEPIIQLLGTNRLLVQLPGIEDRERAEEIIGETARLEFKRREYLVQSEVTSIADVDIVSVGVDYLPEPEDQPSDTGSEPQTESESDTESEPQTEAGSATGTAPQVTGEAEPEVADAEPIVALMVEFTDDAAARFEDVLDRSRDDLILGREAILAGLVGTTIPGSIEIIVDGVELQRPRVLPFGIVRIDDSTTYAFVLPGEGSEGEQPSLEEARRRVGEDAAVSFLQTLWTEDEDTGLTGDDLERAFAGQHAQSQRPIVNLEFNDQGTRVFGELTTDIYVEGQRTSLPDQIAIFLDDEELIAPRVESPITTGTGFIQGADFTIERVRDIALLLESGRLPVPITLIQGRDVDAILGADSLAKSVVAGLVGLGLVLTFMTLYYRLPGLVASVALLIYAALVLAIFKILPVTLTLSGVAAVILSIGMAVDANILIFERMKDELRAGRTLLMSINIGFDRAWPAIRDGNVSTLITCAILFWFADQLGASIVQGFAATLAIGVAVSMFTAIMISRTLLRFVAAARVIRTNRLWLPYGGGEVAQPVGD